MRPTIAEHLLGIARLLDDVVEDEGLSEASRQALADAVKQTRRLAGGADSRHEFLCWDNEASAEILVTLDVAALRTSTGELDQLADDPVERNVELRGLLAAALRSLPKDERGLESRARIQQHLRHRVDANPALNKQPRYPTEDD